MLHSEEKGYCQAVQRSIIYNSSFENATEEILGGSFLLNEKGSKAC